MRRNLFRLGLIFAAAVSMGQGCVSLSGQSGGATGPAGVFVSEDKGKNWTHISLLPTVDGVKTMANVSVYKLVNDPNDPRALYWLSREQGMFYSYDDGKSWRAVEGPLSRGFVYSLAVHPKNPCVIFGANATEVYVSKDCSRSWKEVYRETRADVQVNSLAFNPFSPHQIFMAISSGDLLESIDDGVSWRVVHRFDRQIAQVEVDPYQKGLIYVASRREGLYRSRDNGATWDELGDNMKAFSGAMEYRRFALHPTKTNVLFWISTYGILKSENGGDTWNSIDLITPPGSAQIYGFAINPNNDKEIYYTATINSRSTLYKSSDGGLRWVTERLPSGQMPTVLRVHPTTGDLIYLGFTIAPKPQGSFIGAPPTPQQTR